ncbi:MAG: hypothetical protein ACI92E_001552 [Oceanicoccus sp.]|jgi:hypothetical protein
MSKYKITKSIIAILILTFANASIQAETDHKPKMGMGNGEENWITQDNFTRNEAILTFKEVQINGNGWLVMHPFENGIPNGDKYVALTYLQSGKNPDVNIEVLKGLVSGEKYIVMLHRDVNENKALDFVFVDEQNVLDRAVFEGHTMIGHIIAIP